MKLDEFRLLKAPLFNGCPLSFDFLVKRHENTSNEENEQFPSQNTLFVINVATPLTHLQIMQFFKRFGPITSVEKKEVSSNQLNNYFIRYQVPSQFFYIIFKNLNSLQNVISHSHPLSQDLNSNPCSLNGAIIPFPTYSIKKWFENIITQVKSPEKLESEVNNFMKKFDKIKELEKKKQKKTKFQATDDGFIKVLPGSTIRIDDDHVIRSASTNTFSRGTNSLPFLNKSNSIINKKQKSGKKQQIKDDFYRFQHRQNQQEALAQIRKNMEKDIQKIEQMKKAQKFNIQI